MRGREGTVLLVEHSATVGSSSAVSPPMQWSPAILRYLQEIRTLCHSSSAHVVCGVLVFEGRRVHVLV